VAFVRVAYESNAERLLAELDSRDAVATMRAYADEIDARAATLAAPAAQAARGWAVDPRTCRAHGSAELIRGRADASHRARDLPFFASFESDPDLAERSEEILRAELGR
jgi:hypothetical protein